MRKLRLVLIALAVLSAAGSSFWATAQDSKTADDPIGSLVAILHEADTNHDGRVNLADVRAKRPGFPEPAFHMLDRNKDGFLSAEDLTMPQEAMAVMLHLISVADANHDGRVSLDDVRAVFPFFPEMAFQRLDRNHDGVLSRADLPPDNDLIHLILGLLHDADANQDGQLTLVEIQAIVPSFPQEAFDQLDRNHDGVITKEDIAPPNDLAALLLRLLREADANGDGRVSLADVRTVIPDFPEEAFNHLDRNHDGVLSKDDMPPPVDVIALLIRLLAQADANHDGHLTLDEIRDVMPSFPEDLFERLDRNHDGVISRDDIAPPNELLGLLTRLLKEADANHDGQVTLDEARALIPDFPEDAFNRLDRNKDGALGEEDLPPPPPPDDPVERLLYVLREADANGDGQVTLDELKALMPGATQEQFDRLDRNKDGVLSRADLPSEPPLGSGERLLRILRAADANYDGQVTFDELTVVVPDLTQIQFDTLDRNKDSVLTKADLPAFEDDPGDRLEDLLREADADGDGKITFEELKAVMPDLTQEQFDRLDVNKDGVISRADLPKPPIDPIPRLLQLLKRADADGDGKVTFDELKAVAPDVTQEQFNKLDTNKDGFITKEDLPDRPPDPREWFETMLREADANDDGQVTFDELKAKVSDLTQERFDQLDSNKDGVLTREDIPDKPIPPDDSPRVRLLNALMSADTNQDGELDFAEIAAAFPDAPSDLWAEIDTNHDWVITRGELQAALAKSIEGRVLIRVHDVNADGITNALDVQSIINQALRILSSLLPADMNGDSQVNAVEVQNVINGALGLN